MQDDLVLTFTVPDNADPLPVYTSEDGQPVVVSDADYLLSDGKSLMAPIPAVLSEGPVYINRLGNAVDAIPVTGLASPITGTAPILAPLTDGDELGDAVTWGSYTSTAGDIVEPTTKQMQVDGGAWLTFDGDTVVAEGEVWRVREVVEDTASNSRAFDSGAVEVEAFDPADLFSSGQHGWWPDRFNPADGRMYQISNGLSPIVTFGSPVGLVLDMSQGGGISGPDLITNGQFIEGIAGWSLRGTGAIGWNPSGAIDVTSVSGQVLAYQAFATETGKFYRATGDLVVDRGTDYFIMGPAPNGTPWASINNGGEGARYLIGAATTSSSEMRVGTFTGHTATWGDISVYLLPGYHALQTTNGSRPILRQTGGGVWYLEDDGDNDALLLTLPAGTYSMLWLHHDGTVAHETGLSVTTTLDVLRDGMADAVVRVGTFTSQEVDDMEAWWA